MFFDDEGTPIDPATASVVGATAVLPAATTEFHLGASIEAAITDLMANLPEGKRGEARLILDTDLEGRLEVKAIVGHKVSESLRVAGYASIAQGGKLRAGVEGRVSWEP